MFELAISTTSLAAGASRCGGFPLGTMPGSFTWLDAKGGTAVHHHAVRSGLRSATCGGATRPVERHHRAPFGSLAATTGACALQNEQALIERGN